MKELFLLQPGLVFLNHGSFGACPRPVMEACHAWQLEMERNPVDFLARRSGALMRAARGELAAKLGASPEDLVFLPNATHGVSTMLQSLPLEPGDEVLTTDHEYGACLQACERHCRRSGASLVPVEVPLPFRASGFTDLMWSRVGPRTKAIFLSHISSVTALRFPLEELCARARARGIFTLVDGAHAPGQVPVDLDALGADGYTGNCHKWLCAPKGSAFLHVRRERHPLMEGLTAGWGYVPEGPARRGLDPYTGASLLERRHQWQGTRDLSPFLSVPAALAFRREHGWAGRAAACHAMARELLERLLALGGQEPLAGEADWAPQMVPIPLPPRDPETLHLELRERGIEVPVMFHAGRTILRVSVQVYNGPEDLEALVRALTEVYGFRV